MIVEVSKKRYSKELSISNIFSKTLSKLLLCGYIITLKPLESTFKVEKGQVLYILATKQILLHCKDLQWNCSEITIK